MGNVKIRLDSEIGRLESRESKRREFFARFVKAGEVRAAGDRPSGIIMEAEALRRAVADGLFEARAVFVDHASWFDSPSLRNLAGVTTEARFDEESQSVIGIIRFYRKAAGVAALLDEILAEGGQGPDVGLSIVFWPRWADREEDRGEEAPLRIVGINHIESIDLVFEPAADGRILKALSTYSLNRKEEDAMKKVEVEMDSETIQSGEVHQAWGAAMARASAAAIISASSLPAASKAKLLGQAFSTPEEVEAAIQVEREYLAKLAEDGVVQIGGHAPRGGHIQVGMDGLERISLALEALLMGRSPGKDIPPLSGIREAYIALSGDYEMTGMFHGDRLMFGNVNSSTMAGVVANALNKSVHETFQQYPRWWEALVREESFTNLQQVKWITLGGVGELPTVAEGASYAELTWDDQTETATFVKKGGYLGVTLEAIDKDDTRRLQAAPRALAQAAWLTLGKAISDIFTASSGVGPTMSDGNALFHASHGNLGSTALSVTSYAATRTAMRKITELNSGERLGALVAPRYCVVPPELEITALQVLASEKDYSYALVNAPAAPDNVFAEGDLASARLSSARGRVIVVDLWTDSNNWAVVADPRLYPTIGLGFRYGREPEIFSVASPTAGLMFSNDTLPIKVRFFFAVGPMDWRGLYKHNVS